MKAAPRNAENHLVSVLPEVFFPILEAFVEKWELAADSGTGNFVMICN
jgi:hypothetical protein